MVSTTIGDELARISIVDAEGRVVYDEYVKPKNKIVDYKTRYSGIRESDLAAVTKTQADVIEQLKEIIHRDTILVGHCLYGDFKALGIRHDNIIDTVLLYPHPDGLPFKRSLAYLAINWLRRSIQAEEHSSVEDATATMELALKCINQAGGRTMCLPLPDGQIYEYTEMDYDKAVELLDLDVAKVACMFLRGSRAVGTAGERLDGTQLISDWDLVVVYDTEQKIEDQHINYGNLEAALYDTRTFEVLVRKNTIWVLECIFGLPESLWKESIDYRARFVLDTDALRRSVSFEASR